MEGEKELFYLSLPCLLTPDFELAKSRGHGSFLSQTYPNSRRTKESSKISTTL
jgi:hypothetical protein